MTERRTTIPKDAGTKAPAALVVHADKTIFRLSGRDPVGMLDAILTNEVPESANLGAYALLLNAKGRVQTDLRVIKNGEELFIITEEDGSEATRKILGRYAPFSRVKVEEPDSKLLGLYGGAEELLGLSLSEHESEEVEIEGSRILAVGVETPIRGYDLILPGDSLDPVRDHLLELGAAGSSPEDYKTVRIAAGIPRFGPDITPENFPGETGALDRAVSFQKGCYPGQETVARMHYRGQPNKNLHRFTVKREAPEQEAPQSGTSILQNEKEIGWITSVAPRPVDGKTFALGYLKRKADPAESLQAGGSPLEDAHLC